MTAAAGLAVALAVLTAFAALALGLPRLLRALGLHPAYTGVRHALAGRRALIVTTSQATLDRPGRTPGRATGVFASEFTAPYYAFTDAGMAVDVASVRGGPVPIEPASLRWPLAAPADRRYARDRQLQARLQQSMPLAAIDFTSYDIVFLAGGWGAAYDFAHDAALAGGVSAAWGAGSVVGGVCHGPLGLLGAHDDDGAPLVRGRRLTAVTDRQVRQLRIRFTPHHPESELRAAGALFESARAWRDVFANHVVVDGRLVTGQNQNAGEAVAHQMMRAASAAQAVAHPAAAPAQAPSKPVGPRPAVALLLRVLLGVFGLAALAAGAAFAIAPLQVAGDFAIASTSVAGLGTLRADLGGCFIALGSFTLVGLRRGRARWLLVPLAFIGAFLLLRLLHLGLDGASLAGVRSTVVEAFVAGLLFVGHRQLVAEPLR